jgi:hypothetical protein
MYLLSVRVPHISSFFLSLSFLLVIRFIESNGCNNGYNMEIVEWREKQERRRR